MLQWLLGLLAYTVLHRRLSGWLVTAVFGALVHRINCLPQLLSSTAHPTLHQHLSAYSILTEHTPDLCLMFLQAIDDIVESLTLTAGFSYEEIEAVEDQETDMLDTGLIGLVAMPKKVIKTQELFAEMQKGVRAL